MFKISMVEIGKSKKKYSKRISLIILVLISIAILSAFFSAHTGMKTDYHIYSLASTTKINHQAFLNYEVESDKAMQLLNSNMIDLYFTDSIFLRRTVKSLSASRDLKNLLDWQHEQELYEEYGDSAFPVLIKVEYLEREQAFSFVGTEKPEETREPGEEKVEKINDEEETKVEEESKKGTEEKEEEKGKKEEREEKEEEWKEEIKEEEEGDGEKRGWSVIEEKKEYVTPSEFSVPNPIGKLLYGLLFIVPSYFIIQAFSASLLEDRSLRRLEVLLTTRPKWEVLFGMNLPYIVLSIGLVVATLVAFNERIESLVFIIPLLFFFFSLSTFSAFIARSYREMSFISIVVSIFVALYVFIPAAFSGTVSVSKISPITLLLEYFEGGYFNMHEYLFSTLQFYVMSGTLYYLCLKSFEIEPQRSILDKIFEVSERAVKKGYHAFFASILSIPFIFMLEFFLVLIFFSISRSFIFLLIPVAVAEEFFKGLFISSAYKNGSNLISPAIFSAFGFFLGEKLIVLVNLVEEYDLIFSQLLLFPLLLHVIAAFVFAILLKKGFFKALACSSSVHLLYNVVVVLWIL